MTTRRSFFKGIIAAIALAAIPLRIKEAEAFAVEEDQFERMRLEAIEQIANDIERAFFGIEHVETTWGTVTYMRHPLFEEQA